MTDNERLEKINSIKNRVLTEIFGEDAMKASSTIDYVEKRTIDKNWNTNKSWMDQLRITNPMNNDYEGVGYYNKLLHDNNGVIVTSVENFKPDFSAPPLK